MKQIKISQFFFHRCFLYNVFYHDAKNFLSTFNKKEIVTDWKYSALLLWVSDGAQCANSSICFYIISEQFGLQTSAWSQNARISMKFEDMQRICPICSHKRYPLNKFSKSRMIEIVFFMRFFQDLTCLSSFLITSERIELECWDWAQKTRLSELHLASILPPRARILGETLSASFLLSVLVYNFFNILIDMMPWVYFLAGVSFRKISDFYLFHWIVCLQIAAISKCFELESWDWSRIVDNFP